MNFRLKLSHLLRSKLFMIFVLTVLTIVHIIVVSSILFDARPVIWSLHNDTIHRIGRGADFYAVYHAGINVTYGLSPYLSNNDKVTPYYYSFRYLPVVAWTAQVFTFLTPEKAYAVWVLLLEVFLILLLVVLWRNIPDRWYRLSTISLLLVNSTYFLELYMGQFTFISVTLCFLALFLPTIGPLLFTTSVILKPLSLAIIPAMARKKRYYPTWGVAIICLLIFSIPFFINEPAQWNAFFTTNFKPIGGFHPGNYGFIYLLSLIAVDGEMILLMKHWSTSIGAFRLLLLSSTAILVFLSRRVTIREGAASLILAHFLSYPHVWEHHMTGVCISGAILMTVTGEKKFRYSAILFCLFLLAMPTPFGLFDTVKNPLVVDPSVFWPRYASYIIVLSKVLPTIGLYIITMCSISKNGFRSPWKAIQMCLSNEPDQKIPEKT